MKRNLVPIDEIGPVIRELIEERWPHGSGYEVLAEKIGYDASAIYGIAMVERATADFDLVDNTLCGLGRPDLWWGQFAHIYPVKFMGTCELPSCQKIFAERGAGSKRKRYCSAKCANLGLQVRLGRRTGERMVQKNRCLRGHKLEGDSVYVRPNGHRVCRVCQRETKAKYLSNPANRERQRQHNRRWKAKAAA